MKYIHLQPANFSPNTPIVILFPGGHGCLNWDHSNNTPRWGSNNFLIRNISNFLNKNISVIVVDMHPDKISFDERKLESHGKLVEDMLRSITEDYTSNPKILMLNSAGALSISSMLPIENLSFVFISPVFVEYKNNFNANALIVRNLNDRCEVCHTDFFEDFFNSIKNKFKNVIIAELNSSLAEDTECSARSPHGFWGIDTEVLDHIFNFIKKETFK